MKLAQNKTLHVSIFDRLFACTSCHISTQYSDWSHVAGMNDARKCLSLCKLNVKRGFHHDRWVVSILRILSFFSSLMGFIFWKFYMKAGFHHVLASMHGISYFCIRWLLMMCPTCIGYQMIHIIIRICILFMRYLSIQHWWRVPHAWYYAIKRFIFSQSF